MGMNAMYDIRDMLCKELDEIARKGEMSAGDLETVHKLTDTIKNIDKIEMYEEDGGYSRGGEWEADMRGVYGKGNSYRGRKRDSMGRYSRAGDTTHLREQLREMMRDTDDERVKEALRRAMSSLEG